MNKDEILKKSREEYQNRDLAEIHVLVEAGSMAGRAGACVCCLISIMALRMANIFLYSPWIIYFSILGTNYFVRYLRIKRKSDLFLSCLFYSMGILAFAGFGMRLIGEAG